MPQLPGLRGGGLVFAGGVHRAGEFAGEGGEGASDTLVEVRHTGQIGLDGGLHAPEAVFGVFGCREEVKLRKTPIIGVFRYFWA